ncbi:MAG TPA: hypothetical protein VKV05_11890 [Terriglobales bacterium]|nr:hypothetical protein [Terriglobales bacterium]
MRTLQSPAVILCLSLAMFGQQGPAPAVAPGNSSAPLIFSDLDRLQGAAAQANRTLGEMRIEKWKTGSGGKQQAQANADAVQRNLAEALPGLIADVRKAPQDVNAQFKLYRNLNVLYDVFASLTESAGAFGPRSDYEALAQQLSVIDSVRRDLGDNLETLTLAAQSELTRLRAQVQTLQEQARSAVPPKKVIVDDTAPAKKSSHKKKATHTSTPPGNNSSNSGASAKPE